MHIKTAISDDEIVDVNAQQQKVIILTEQLNISRARRIVMQLLDELEDQVMNREFYENLGDMMGFLDESGHDKLNDL